MKFYLKLLFCYFLIQNILSDDKLSLASFSTDESSGFLNNTLNNSTLNSTTPVLLNCTEGVNNSTDLSKCTPINVTLSFECTKVAYDFLIYSVNWQPKLCHAKDCSKHSNESPKWRIQGLRGSFRNGTRPVQCCSDKQLKVQELEPIISDLKENWAFDQDSGVKDSVIEEWNLHGSCVQENEQKSSLQLFQKSLDFSRKMPLELWLSNARIEPSNDKKYGLQFFNYTITSKLTKKIQMRCKTYDYDKRISIIDTINVCVDKDTSEMIDCPQDFDSNCLDMIYYPINLLDYKVNEEILYRDMNYYRYNNYHRSYSPFFSSHRSAFLTGAAVGAIPAATLALPAAYYYFKNQNRKKYGNMYPGAGGYGGMPWYASTSFANSFAPSPNMYGANRNFGNLGPVGGNMYPRQNPAFYPSSIYATPRGFGNLNTPDLSPNFYRPGGTGNYPSGNYPSGSYPNYPPPKYGSPSYPNPGSNQPSYPAYPNSGSNSGNYPKSGSNQPSYPAYPNSGSNSGNYPKSGSNQPSYPAYPNGGSNQPNYPSYPNSGSNSGNYPKSGNLPSAPPAYNDKSGSYPKSSSNDKPPSYSTLNDKQKSGSLYPKTSDLGNSGKYSPSAPSFNDLSSSNNNGKSNNPSYPSYGSSSSNNKYKPSSSSTSNSKPKSSGSSGGIFGGSSRSKSSGGSSSSSSSSSRGRSYGSGRSRGGGMGRSRG